MFDIPSSIDVVVVAPAWRAGLNAGLANGVEPPRKLPPSMVTSPSAVQQHISTVPACFSTSLRT